MAQDFYDQLLSEHQICQTCPSPAEVTAFFKSIMGFFYLDFAEKKFESLADLKIEHIALKKRFEELLCRNPMNAILGTEKVCNAFFDLLPNIYQLLNQDIMAIYEGDPACNSRREVIRSYPGFYAISAYRVANAMYNLNIEDLPRITTEHAHSETGIDIHPGATIGSSFCIDHGTGVVIGETAEIHENVKIYQGVTLGALSVQKSDANKKRHPTIEKNCILYAGSTILGGETVIGHDSVVGGNVWLTKSLPPKSKIYYQATMNDDSGKLDRIVYKEYAK